MNESIKKSIIIRADASDKIGAGHVMRCLALAQAWLDAQGDATFVCHNLPKSLRRRLDHDGVNILHSAGAPGSSEDAKQILKIAAEQKANAIVVDGYIFGQVYQDKIAEFAGYSLTVDDYGHLSRYRTRFVLNQNLGASEVQYVNRDESTELLLGTAYALIRREFLHHPERNRIRDGSVSRILVTLGGSDPHNVTETVVRGLRLLPRQDLTFRILAGFQENRCACIAALTADDSRFEILPAADDMASQYAWADFAIAAGGSSNWEMCLFNLPRMLVVTAQNQVVIANSLSNANAIVPSKSYLTIKSEDVRDTIHEVTNSSGTIRALVENCKQIQIAQDLSHVVRALRGLTWVRTATERDTKLYFDWVNEAAVRENSLVSKPVRWEEHEAWFAQRVKSENSALYVGMLGTRPIGQVRFDVRNEEAEIDFSIDASFRKRGLGREVLQLALDAFRKRRNVSIRATVKPENRASLACFEKLGFVRQKELDGGLRAFCLPILPDAPI